MVAVTSFVYGFSVAIATYFFMAITGALMDRSIAGFFMHRCVSIARFCVDRGMAISPIVNVHGMAKTSPMAGPVSAMSSISR